MLLYPIICADSSSHFLKEPTKVNKPSAEPVGFALLLIALFVGVAAIVFGLDGFDTMLQFGGCLNCGI